MTPSEGLSQNDEIAQQPAWTRNTGMMVGGIVTAAIGGGAFLTGVSMLFTSDSARLQTCNGQDCQPATNDARQVVRTAGWITLAAGAAAVAIGLPLIVFGARRRPLTSATSNPSVEVMVTPSGGGLRASF